MTERFVPGLYALPPGVDFARALVDGLRERFGSAETLARVELYVNSTRMARRVRTVFDSGPPGLLPRIRLVTDIADPIDRATLPQPEPALRRRLELTTLVSKLLESQPDLAPRASLFDLSDSLAALMEDMQVEGVSPDALFGLDVSDQSGHWDRALQFLRIVQPFFAGDDNPDAQRYTRLALEQRLKRWADTPPDHPVIVAGSTGSRGTTATFMQAVAQLPQGAVVLPGFDYDIPQPVWDRLQEPLTMSDHPQHRQARIMQALGLSRDEVRLWHRVTAPAPDRNAVLSLALRPAPITHQWMVEGPSLPELSNAMTDVTLLEAPGQREEATTIALRLRAAAQDGVRAALITPDRMLTRQVTSALARWNIKPDDSAGIPAQLTPPGRFLRHVAGLMRAPLTAEALLTLLKHPLCHSGDDRGPHVFNTNALELQIRRKGWAYPLPHLIRAWGESEKIAEWTDWVAATFCDRSDSEKRSLSDWLERHMALAERIARGSHAGGSGGLWEKNAGRALHNIVSDLQDHASVAVDMTAGDYADLFGAVVSRGEVRDRDEGHPDILIWGTLEARVMDADLLILAGLNEGSWPETPAADPWLNRQMRAKTGLTLPERRIGLSAHDFQQAFAAREVWLTRSVKSQEAETVPSRWLNRLTNLLNGLPDNGGKDALTEMRARGARWLAMARSTETPLHADPAPRPSPAPPIAARPRELPVTAIKTLVRDPYAIYAKYILKLRPLDPLMRAPDALLRGILLHDVLEAFLRETLDDPSRLSADTLCNVAARFTGDAERLPFPTARALWQSRIEQVADWFAESERERRAWAQPTPDLFETRGALEIPALGFKLTAKADRIDIDEAGGAHIYDYKTGQAPSTKQQEHFDKQLLLETVIAQQGGFAKLGPRPVARAVFISLKPGEMAEVAAPLEDHPPDTVWQDFTALIARYCDEDRGYSARISLMKDNDISDYDHLSRFGEWDVTAMAEQQKVD